MSEFIIDELVSIKPNHVGYDGYKYFRKGANKIHLGSHGRKQASPLSVNYMSVSGRIARRHLENVPIKSYGPIEVNWQDATTSDLGQSGMLKFFGLDTSVVHGVDKETAQAQSLKLMNFWINQNPLKNCLNNDANTVRNSMAEEGKDARVVSSILVIMEAQLAEFFSTQSSTSLTANGTDGELGITAGNSRAASKTITLANGTTFAYGLHKAKWRNGKSEIKELEDDWFSFG